VDEHTGKKFTFFSDPDELPIELYQIWLWLKIRPNPQLLP
jgi:hypothetical protein